MMEFWLSINSFMMVFRRSSNCPRYFVPANDERQVKRKNAFVSEERRHVTVGNALRRALPTMAVLPTPGSPISTGLFLVRRQRIWNYAIDFAFAAHQRVKRAFRRGLR